MLKHPKRKKIIKNICIVSCFWLLGFSSIACAQETAAGVDTNLKLSSPEISNASYLNGVEFAAEGKFKEAGEQFAAALATNEFNYDAEVALDIINAFNKGTINETYTITTFTSRLVKLKLSTIESMLKDTQDKLSASKEQIENMEKQITDLKKQFDNKIFDLRSKVDSLESDIDRMKSRDTVR